MHRDFLRVAALAFCTVGVLFSPARGTLAQPTPPSAPAGTRYDRKAPFEAVRWTDGKPEVLVKDAWYKLVSIDGRTVAEILDFNRKTWGEDFVTKRFEEDLIEVLSRMGAPPKDTVRLAVIDAAGAEQTIDALLTEENRRRLRQSGTLRTFASTTPSLSRARAELAIDQLAALLATSHSYSLLPGNNTAAAAQAAKQGLKDQNPAAQLEAALFTLIAPTGDGHANVSIAGAPNPGPFLPFIPVPIGAHAEGKVAAIKPDRSGLVDPDYPFLAAIDGIELARWINAAETFSASGSPQLKRDRSCRTLLSFGQVAPLLGSAPRTAGERVAVTLSNAAGATRAVEFRLAATRPESIDWPVAESRIIEHGQSRLGYLRIPEMDRGPDFERKILGDLATFKDCRGLIIDVRSNGGGARDIINILGPRLLPPGAEPVVYNASRSIQLPGETAAQKDDRLASRYLFRADDPRWSDLERAAIARFTAIFNPEVQLPDDRFGPWYFALTSPASPQTPRVAMPVVVLQNEGCFSATDVFLAAMSLMPNVTLLGQPSGGGSGLTRTHEFTVTPSNAQERPVRFSARLSTMVSFTADGMLFDTRGIQPDQIVQPIPTDFVSGGTDTQLDAAIARLAPR